MAAGIGVRRWRRYLAFGAAAVVVAALAIVAGTLIWERARADGGPEYCEDYSLLPCPRQVAWAAVPVAGSPFALTYTSDRVPGRQAAAAVDARPLGLAGWSLDILHSYDPAAGALVLGDGQRRPVAATEIDLDGEPRLAVPSIDATGLYVFDREGRHLRTYDARSGAVRFEFGWDEAGLAAVIEPDERVTTIHRDGDGDPSAIVSAAGYRTRLGVRGSWLAAVADPAGRVTTVHSTGDGLLTRLVDATGAVTEWAYDSDGRLVEHRSPAGVTTTYARTSRRGGFSVEATTGAGRGWQDTVRYRRGQVIHEHRDPAGGLSSVRVNGDDRLLTGPDGATVALTLAPDPRWGMAAPVVAATTLTSAAGQVATATQARELADSTPGVVPVGQRLMYEVDGARWVTEHDPQSLTTTLSYPTGQARVLRHDAAGRVVRDQLDGFPPTSYSYDGGLLTSVSRGEGGQRREWRYTYDHDTGDVAVTDSLGNTTIVAHDRAGRPVAVTGPDGHSTRFDRDELGRVSAAAAPGRTPPLIQFDPDGRVDTVAHPPGAGGLEFDSYTYDLDGALVQLTHADGGGVSYQYDARGRPASIDAGAGQWQVEYDPAGLPVSLAAPGVALNRSFDSGMVVGEAWSGPFEASVDHVLDEWGRLASTRVNGAETGYEYDPAGQLTRAGELEISYQPQTGLVAREQLGGLTRDFAYNDFGEPVGVTVTGPGGATVYEGRWQRDRLGRVTGRTESFADGTTAVREFGYDEGGRLATTSDDGGEPARYEYDAAGNLVTETRPDGSRVTSRYDERDALVARDGVDYRYDPAGRLAGVGGTGYEYDRLGNLLRVTPPAGPEISYQVDGAGRRVAKLVDGELAQGFAYYDGLRPAAELDGSGEVAARFGYGPTSLAPSYVVREGRSLLVVTDHIGTPRLLVDADTGEVAERLDTDPWGRGSASRLIPFGFAGGLADADTGLLRFGVRDYDPVTTRWTARDPLGAGGGDANLYRYVRADPVNHIDVNGLWPCDIFAIGVDISVGIFIGGYLEDGVVITGKGGYEAYEEYGGGLTAPAAADVGVIATCLREREPSKDAQEQLDKYAGSGQTTGVSYGPATVEHVIAYGPESWSGEHAARGISVSISGGPFSAFSPWGINHHQTFTRILPKLPKPWTKPGGAGGPAAAQPRPQTHPPGDGSNGQGLCATSGLCDSGSDGGPGAAGPGAAGPGAAGPGERSMWDEVADRLRDMISSRGDPHLRTANDVAYSFQAVGEFTALRSDSGDLVIQVRQQPVSTSRLASFNTGVALNVNGDRVTFQVEQAEVQQEVVARLDGTVLAADGAVALSGGGQLIAEGDSGAYLVVWPDGSLLHLTHSWGRSIDIGLELSTGRVDTVHGLLGPNPAEKTRHVVTAGGTAIPAGDLSDHDTRYRTFGDSWRLAQEESLFDYGPGESTDTFTDLDFPDRLSDVVQADALARAEALCEQLGVPESERESCAFDVSVTGDAGFAVTTQRFLTGPRPSVAAAHALTGGEPGEPGAGPRRPAPVTGDESTFTVLVGEQVSGAIGAPGDEHRYTLTLAAGQVIYLQAGADCDNLAVRWSLVEPAGGGTLARPVCQDLGRYVAGEAGTYEVVIRGDQGATGGYGFEILDSGPDGGGTVRVGDPVSGSISRPGAENRYEFTAQPGQVLYVRAAGDCTDHNLWWRLADPDGQGTLSRPVCQDLGPYHVTRPGTYTIVVNGLAGATGDYTFTLEESQ